MRFVALLPLPCLVLVLACRPPAPDGGETGEGDPTTPPAAASSGRAAVLVRTLPVQVGAIEQRQELSAKVESLDVVDVFPEHSEPVLEILVEEGDVVQRDQPLARLRDEVCQLVLSEARVRLTEAENARDRARRDHERNLALARSSDITERELETSAQAKLAAETAYEAAKVGVDRAQFDLDRCTIQAPITGTVSARDLSLGDMANPGQRAFQIVDLSAPKAIFFRPQRELPLLHVGQPLTGTSEALPGVLIQGRIERIAPTVDPNSGTVAVTAALHAEGVQIPVGILVEIDLILDVHPEALLVPKKALLYQGRRPYCFVVRDGRARRIDCDPGYENAEFLEVMPGPDSLTREDMVVVVGADRLADGDLVEVAAAE